ncbi:hypothetical protein Gotri_026554 [Gossypium trilobum]|uniref:Uncharacterized protein n=1 Tax=Gossypium trilobum TaxID=34281 RepID=A0A7J9FIA1_9ROSI|nr:hypothetical protein [Gossypium trilobum]
MLQKMINSSTHILRIRLTALVLL